MSEIALKAQKRGTGKKAAKAVRNSGLVTGVYYRNGVEPIPIAVHPLNMRPIVYTAAANIINLEIEGSDAPLSCMLKDITFDPVTDAIVHFDLFGVSNENVVDFNVPVKLVGQSAGVREGGVLEHILHKLNVTCLPKDLPQQLDVDITELKIGQSLHVRDLSYPGIKINVVGDATVVAISAPRRKATEEDRK
ncbi:MAG: 50S ribosomal protein L25 [Candidatus Kapaibacteriota bacterium]|jgi:large subunit ribosomal protein L25